ncbi:MAG: DUF6600 domain-containing protein [Burkholderiaceae bacterium]
MKSFARIVLGALAAVAACSISVGAFADVPGRVGRIAYVQGDVQAYSETDPEWKVAYVNQPITSRNSVFVGDAGRAEITVGSTTLAMDAGSQVDIQQLDDNTFNANVVRGRVSMRIHRLDANDEYNIAAPGGDFALLKPGRYRIDALEDSSGVTVFAGQASVQTANGPMLVNAGSALRAASDPSNPDAQASFRSTASVPVPLDDWVVARETRFRDGQASRYVSPRMTGYEDLDANGRWATEADYGPVWYPTTHVQADWVPYRYGRWAYVAPWGYTWIDDAPWGFAPFHYGRWVQVGSRWGWCPGAYVARPVYAPALVGFYGGSGFSASFSVGSAAAVGWYPLAPWQRYSPHYTNNVTYIRQVNNITIVNPPARFARERDGHDWNRFHGGTVAPTDAFASQRSISRVAMAAPRDLVARAAPVNVAALPRPEAIPAAIRSGPRAGEGIGRPEFRSPREFAARPFEGGRARAEIRNPQQPQTQAPQQQQVQRAPQALQVQQAQQAQQAPQAQQAQQAQQVQQVQEAQQRQARERNALPPNYRRMQEAERANERNTAANVQPFQGPAVPGQPDRPAQVQHSPNAPSFNANARPMQQAVPQPGVEGQGVVATQPRFQPRVQPNNRGERGGERFNERGAEGEARIAPAAPAQPQIQRPQQALPAVEAPAPRLGRPEREMRNIQPRPQPVERPQQVAPIAPAPPPAPVVAAPPPQRIEAPRAPQAEARIPERGPGREGPGREGPGREGPNRVNQER